MSLFNPTFLLFLALLLLVSGLLLFYMDIKMREQNHKIKAIADLATTIAQSIKGGNVSSNSNCDNESTRKESTRKETTRENIQLIQVSDDEAEDDDDDNDEDSDSDDSSSSDDDDDDDAEGEQDEEEQEEQEEQEEHVKLNIHDTDSDIKHVFLSQEQLTEAKEEPVEASVVEASAVELEPQEAQVNPPSEAERDLDTFKIVLSSELDYKKTSIQKLRQLVSEKGLAPSSDTSKMKKPELLKLLEAE